MVPVMSETTSQSRNAAIVVAILTLGGIVAGVVVPNVLTEHHVEYGTWPADADPGVRRCVVGTVWIGDDVRALGRLPLVADGAPPYCMYRACFDPGNPALGAFGDTASTPAGMDPLFAEVEEAWQAPWPPLAVWCGGDEADEPPGCACAPPGAACEALTTDLNGTSTWAPASPGVAYGRDRWRGAGCVKTPCTVLAGRDYFPSECHAP